MEIQFLKMKYTENIIKEIVKDFQNGGGKKEKRFQPDS